MSLQFGPSIMSLLPNMVPPTSNLSTLTHPPQFYLTLPTYDKKVEGGWGEKKKKTYTARLPPKYIR